MQKKAHRHSFPFEIEFHRQTLISLFVIFPSRKRIENAVSHQYLDQLEITATKADKHFCI